MAEVRTRGPAASPPPPNGVSIALFGASRPSGEGPSVLLVKRARAPLSGFWSLPGGRIEPGESPETAVARELFEETGLVVSDPLFVRTHETSASGTKFRLAVFAALHPVRAPLPSLEIADWDWTSPGTLPRDRCTPGLAEVVASCARHLSDAGFLDAEI